MRFVILFIGYLEHRKTSLIRVFMISTILSATGFVSGCSDPYEQCMKAEKRRNAYLGEEEYLKESAITCAKKVRESR